jgi:CheY-like chemotaxis protein
MEAIGRITGGVAHDFNNLLTAIGGAFQLLGRRLDPDHPGQRYIEAGNQATRRGAKVASQLLAFSARQKLDLRPTDLGAALRAAVPLVAHALGPTISLELALVDDEAWARTAADQLELAVVNLALNARDAMPGGGEVVLGLARDQCPGKLAAWQVWMRDNGPGMAPEVALRALEPFFTTKERGKGTGLGLAQVYGFARQCGGEVTIESTPGNGVTVRIRLPQTTIPIRLAEPASPDASVMPAIEKRGPACRVLVVDDDEMVRQVLADGLRLDGFEVSEASDGPSGLDLIERQSHDAVVLDFAMPGMNGVEVAKRARALRPGLPVLFCSGYADTLALEEVKDAVVLRKPLAVSALGEAVVRMLTRDRLKPGGGVGEAENDRSRGTG